MSFVDRFFAGSSDIAMDLGTANTVVYVRGKGIVLAEPSVVAIQTSAGIDRVLAVGEEAKLILGKAPEGVRAVRPLRSGVISELEIAEQMIKHFIAKALGRQRYLSSPELVVAVPSGATAVERHAIRDAATNAGARKVWLIDEPLAAAIGANLPVTNPIGSMVVDIGGGTTEVGVVSVGGLQMASSVRVGGDQMDEAIASQIRRCHNLVIGETTAEQVKMKIGAARMPQGKKVVKCTIKGRDLAHGLPGQLEVTKQEVAEALSEPVAQIVTVVRGALEKMAPEIAADLIEGGIVLTGGGALLAELDAVLAEATGLPVAIASDPLNCVALGAGHALEDAVYRGVLQAA
jgi:rod shape-determining protein MreB